MKLLLGRLLYCVVLHSVLNSSLEGFNEVTQFPLYQSADGAKQSIRIARFKREAKGSPSDRRLPY